VETGELPGEEGGFEESAQPARRRRVAEAGRARRNFFMSGRGE